MTTTRHLLVFLIVISLAVCDPPQVSCFQCAGMFGGGWTCPKTKELGRGSSGIVFLVSNGVRNACIKAQYVKTDDEFTKAHGEATLLMRLNHENVIKIQEYMHDKQNRIFYTLIEYAGNGALDQFIFKNPAYFMDTRNAVVFLKKMCEGFQYLHTNEKIHGDIKPGNMAVDDKMNPKIIDFDMAKNLNEPVKWHSGTLPFMDPRVLNGILTKWDTATEVYSIGVSLYQMVHGGKLPYNAMDQAGMRVAVNGGRYTIDDGVDLLLAKIIEGMLRNSPITRISLKEVIMMCKFWLENPVFKPINRINIDAYRSYSESEFSLKNTQAGGNVGGVQPIGGIQLVNNVGGNQRLSPTPKPNILNNPPQPLVRKEKIFDNPPLQDVKVQSPFLQKPAVQQNIVQNFVQAPAQKNYAPVQQNYSPSPQQNYSPKVQQNYAPVQQNYAPVQQNYNPTPKVQQNYSPSPQQNYSPKVQQNYSPMPQQNYNPAPQQKYIYQQRMLGQGKASAESVTPFEWVVFAVSMAILFAGVAALLKWFSNLHGDESLVKSLNPAAPTTQAQQDESVNGVQVQVA